MDPVRKKQRKGFALWPKDKLRDVARQGGVAVHAQGSAHEFTREEAAEAGRKGGIAVAQDVDHMREMGRKGGIARARNARDEGKVAS